MANSLTTGFIMTVAMYGTFWSKINSYFSNGYTRIRGYKLNQFVPEVTPISIDKMRMNPKRNKTFRIQVNLLPPQLPRKGKYIVRYYKFLNMDFLWKLSAKTWKFNTWFLLHNWSRWKWESTTTSVIDMWEGISLNSFPDISDIKFNNESFDCWSLLNNFRILLINFQCNKEIMWFGGLTIKVVGISW